MAALAAESIAIQPSAPERAVASREESPRASADLPPHALPNLSYEGSINRVENLHIQDVEVTVSRRNQVLRELSCYASLYISGY